MASSWRPPLVGAALIVGLSPALVVAIGQIGDEPRLYYVVAMLALLVHLARTTPPDAEARLASAIPWVIAAVVIQLLAAAGGFPRFSRFALPFGMVAFLRGVFAVPLPVSLLSFLCVPPPHALTAPLGIEYAEFWSHLASKVSPGKLGTVVAWDGGVRLMALAAGTVAYRCLHAGLALHRSILPLACACVLAVPLQILAMVLARWSPTALAELVLIHGSWILAFGVFLFVPLPFLRLPTPGRSAGAHAL